MSDAGDVPSSGPNSSPSSGGGGSHPGTPRGTPVYSVDAQDIIAAIERPNMMPDDVPFHRGLLPLLDLPSFGEPDDDCGDPCPGSMYFCPSCCTVHQKPHVCYRYDCPLHWAHAVRRRAAGSKDAAGVCPQLDALRRYLNAYRDDNQYFHHLVISLGKERRLAANEPLERELETVREIMDEIGIQGLVGYHPRAGDNEDHEGDDRGDWKNRIGKDTDWEDVREELEFRPHFHIVGVAPFIDFSETPEIQSETGAVLHRITQEDSNISIEDTEAMCSAVTYVLSHCGIYDTDGDQRRLAAWMKGPDIGRITPLERNKAKIQATVYDVARDTLGVEPPNLECDSELDQDEERQGNVDEGPAIDREQRNPMLDAWDTGDDVERVGATSTGNGVTIDGPPGPDGPAGPIASAGSGATPSRSTDLPGRRDPFDTPAGNPTFTSSTSSTSSPTRSRSTSSSDDQDDESETCGTRLRHISQANEYLLDREWNESHDDDVLDVETAYRSYVTWMEAKGLEATDDPTPLPEERVTDYPPDD